MKTIASIYLIISFLTGGTITVFPQDCQWSSQAGGTLSDCAGAVATDLSGNMYVFGSTRSSPCYFQTDTITHGSTSFLIKYNPSGAEEWIIEFDSYSPSSSDIYAFISGIDHDTILNNLLLTGTFYNWLVLPDTILFGNEQTVFLVTLNTDGHVIWARTAGGTGNDEAFGITYDNQSNIYISGASDDSVTFDHITIPKGGFLAKYDIDGNLIWSKRISRFYSASSILTEAPPINIAYSGDILFVNGYTLNDTIVIDTMTIILEPNIKSVYLARFNNDGNIVGLTIAGGISSFCGNQLVAGAGGFVYLTGIFEGSLGIFGNDTLTSQANYCDCFLSKLNPSGEFLWTIQLHSTEQAWGRGLALDESGNIYLSGDFYGVTQFGPTILTSGSYSDMFLARYSPEGTCIGVRQYSKGQIPRIDVDNQGNVCLAGGFENTLEIGPNTFISRGWIDLFAAKCSPITGVPQPLESSSNTLLIYANPNTGQCTITIPEEFRQEKNLRLQIYDQTGRLIQETRIEMAGESVRLDIRAQAKGLYHAVLSNGKKSYQGKIVFE